MLCGQRKALSEMQSEGFTRLKTFVSLCFRPENVVGFKLLVQNISKSRIHRKEAVLAVMKGELGHCSEPE